MGTKTIVGGTGYEIKGGTCLIGGTGYAIKKGRTLIGGTGYDIRVGGKVQLSVSTPAPLYAHLQITASGGQSGLDIEGYDAVNTTLEYETGTEVTFRLVSSTQPVVFYFDNVWSAGTADFTKTITLDKNYTVTAEWGYDQFLAANAMIIRVTGNGG